MQEDLVRDLLREQHPDLAALPIREVAGGWGNQMWRLGDELAARMQRMDKSPDLQLKERRWLPVLAPRLPLPVPTPVRSGVPSQRFPEMWTVMTWVEGTPLDHGSITRSDDAADRLAGVVDFGDIFAGDPAWDLAAAWVLLPAGGAARFFDSYAQADEAAIRRARGLAALKSLFLMLMGQNGDRGLPGGKPRWGPAGQVEDRQAIGVRKRKRIPVGIAQHAAPLGLCVSAGKGSKARTVFRGCPSEMPSSAARCS